MLNKRAYSLVRFVNGKVSQTVPLYPIFLTHLVLLLKKPRFCLIKIIFESIILLLVKRFERVVLEFSCLNEFFVFAPDSFNKLGDMSEIDQI